MSSIEYPHTDATLAATFPQDYIGGIDAARAGETNYLENPLMRDHFDNLKYEAAAAFRAGFNEIVQQPEDQERK